MINEDKLRELLSRQESQTLDFKGEPYRFDSDDSKSKFIKDILAMANTPRDEAAYIIIGVKANADGSKELVGVDIQQHPEDADLQQRINPARVEPKPTFLYQPISLDGRSYGVIEISLKKNGPYFATKDFGVLKAHQLYFRRGTRNSEATTIDIYVIYEWFRGRSESESLLWNVPYHRNPFFTDREDVLQSLHDTFRQGKAAALTQAISGLGGTGKTQIAAEYAYRYHYEYQAVLWVKADSREVLTSDFVNIAYLLNLPEKNEQDQNQVVTVVKRWLQSHTGWLLIFDNADNLAIAKDFIPLIGKGHTLLTTQAQATGRTARRIEIERLEPEVGALFLLRRANIIPPDDSLTSVSEDDRAKAGEISEVMDGLPLALDQAGAYIEETRCSLSRYLDLYEIQRAKLLQRRGYSSDHPESVTTTFSLSFEKVQQANPAAVELLRFCAFLHSDDIPEEIFTEGAPELGPVLQPVAADPMRLDETIAELLRYSLVHRDSDAKALSIHRLVQAVLRDGMGEDVQRQWAERAVKAVNRTFPTVEYATWSQCQRLLPHAQSCAVLIEQWNMAFIEAARLLFQTATYLQRRAQNTQAESLHQQTLALREKLLGPEHSDTALSLSSMAWLYFAQGKYSQTGQLAQRGLEIREKLLGPEHPDVADSLNQLAVLYRTQGRYEQAEQFLQQALTIYIQTRGIEHSDTAFCLQNLAVLYRSQRNYTQAERLSRRVLEIREKILGPEHPETAYSLSQLAELYYAQGKYEQAEPLYQRALEIREKILGPEHPNTAFSLNKLAELYQFSHAPGKYGQAEPLYHRALAIYEQTGGPESPDVAFTLNHLAKLYRIQGRYEEAEPLFIRALTVFEKTLGAEHPILAAVLNDYAILQRKTNREAAAAELEARAKAIRAKHTQENPGQ